MRDIDCEICGKRVTPTNGKQLTCDTRACRLKLRSESRSANYYALRKAPTCVWCLEPILEPRKRQYHTECLADKNRERVREYDLGKLAGAKSTPGKKRSFTGSVKCAFCKRTVARTGSRQITCKERACENARKNKRKQESRAIHQRLELERARKLQKIERARPRREDDEGASYRYRMAF